MCVWFCWRYFFCEECFCPGCTLLLYRAEKVDGRRLQSPVPARLEGRVGSLTGGENWRAITAVEASNGQRPHALYVLMP